MSSFSNKIIGGAVWAAIETWGRQISVFAVFVILARYIGPAELGLAALAMVVPVLAGVPIKIGIPDALIQRADIQPAHLNSAFWLLFGAGAAISCLIWLCAEFIADCFGQPMLSELIRWCGLVLIFHGLTAVPIAYLRRNFEFRLLAVRTFVGTAVSGALGLWLAYAGYGAWALVWMNLSKAAIESVVILIAGRWRPRLEFSLSRIQDLSGFAGPLVAQSLWTYINDEIPKVVLGGILGPQAVGIYAFARRPLDLLSEALLSPVVSVTLPAVSRFQSQPAKIDHFFDTATRMAALIGFPIFVGFAAVAPIAIPMIFGEQWTVSVLATQLLMILGLQRTLDNVCAFSVLALGHSRLLLKLNVAYTAVTLVVLPAAAYQGFESAILALVFCNVLFVPVFLVLAQKQAKIHVRRPLEILPRIGLACAVMFAIVTAWLHAVPQTVAPQIVLASGVAIGAFVYLVFVLVLLRPDFVVARNLILRARGSV